MTTTPRKALLAAQRELKAVTNTDEYVAFIDDDVPLPPELEERLEKARADWRTATAALAGRPTADHVDRTPEVKQIAAAWKKAEHAKKYGMEFGRLCYEYQQKYATSSGLGNKGKGMVPMLESLAIPVSTAYWWIDRYEEEAGLKPVPEAEPEPEAETVSPETETQPERQPRNADSPIVPWNCKTPHGHNFDEARSAFQKCIRRGLEDDALYWLSQICLAGNSGYTHAWTCIKTVCSEDIGIADVGITADIAALHENFSQWKNDPHHKYRLPIVHATLLLCRCKKSRLVDEATIVFFEGNPQRRELPADIQDAIGSSLEKREVPDFAIDVHTQRGRQMGRDAEHFFNEGAVLTNALAELTGPTFCTRASERVYITT